jgi:hypothetical protein
VKPGRGDEVVELFNKFDYGDNTIVWIAPALYAAFSTAPSGTSPWVTLRQTAINSLRARATDWLVPPEPDDLEHEGFWRQPL